MDVEADIITVIIEDDENEDDIIRVKDYFYLEGDRLADEVYNILDGKKTKNHIIYFDVLEHLMMRRLNVDYNTLMNTPYEILLRTYMFDIIEDRRNRNSSQQQ